MQFTTSLSVLATALSLVTAQTTTEPVTGILGNASVVENNPAGVVYTATLPTTEFNNPADPRGNVKGYISAVAAAGGKGVDFTVNFSNLPTSGGPFLYHLHVLPVDAKGNCTATLAHLDPYVRGETPVCDPSLPETCQVGDLSGKYGKITTDPFTASYTDLYASTASGIGAYFGNRSIVLHFGNKTRITCANFMQSNSSHAPNATSSYPAPPAQFTGAAGRMEVVSMFGLLAIAGLAFAL